MKILVAALIIATASADFRAYNQRYPSENQEQDGPYQPSGWRPSGPPFALPARQQLPRFDYGPPPQTYGTPAQEYGPPLTTTTESQETTTTEAPTTTEGGQEAEQLNNLDKENEVKENEKLTDESPAVTQQGIYYIYHPTGLLQRVIYMTRDDVRNMAYSAQLKYQDVEPIREPIYTYDPKTFVFRRLQL
ncbi:hypothetical protein BDFB_009192 [Asbolus verrucosus]|uniref:DUF4794 domain-containing protein n=1 Tax=Asbolus verrucosus TaxID=1661398 RepID=A0A482VW88_ASBVE|nr:hypothetical protein BDFB_009192 [Asbolus verrucosus]